MKKLNFKTETRILHAGKMPNLGVSIPESVPIFMTSSYALPDLDGLSELRSTKQGYYYTRCDNPNYTSLAEVIAIAEGGEEAVICASGMAAIFTGVISLVNKGDHILANDELYGESYDLFKNVFQKFGIEATFVDFNDPEAIKKAIQPNTKLFYTEIISNPLTKVVDIDSVVEIAHGIGAKVVVDSTFTTPCLIRPIEHGVDMVLHSLTKFINGHFDVTAGAIVSSSEIINEVRPLIVIFGGILSPYSAWLALRGIKTMNLRVMKQVQNASLVASALEKHPKVNKVYYPGLESHPQHSLATRLLKNGYGAMLSFGIADDKQKVNDFMQSLQLIRFVNTLGGIKTTLSHPATTSHIFVEEAIRRKMGIHDGLLRLSVGIEDPDDLINDIYNALESV